MDSITHIALGACIGETALSKQIGKKALILGAVAQSLSDKGWNGKTIIKMYHRIKGNKSK